VRHEDSQRYTESRACGEAAHGAQPPLVLLTEGGDVTRRLRASRGLPEVHRESCVR
jgi:hypothetical protein